MAVGQEGPITTSLDGNDWTGLTEGPRVLNSVVAGDSLWVAVGENGRIFTSPKPPSSAISPVLSPNHLLGMRVTSSRLVITLPPILRGRIDRAACYTLAGNLMNKWHGLGSRKELTLPMADIPAGSYLLEIQASDTRFMLPFNLAR